MIYTAAGFLDAALCNRVRAAMDRGASEPAEILDDTFTFDGRVRLASSIEIDPGMLRVVEGALDGQRGAIAGFFDIPLTGREGAGFLRYKPGGLYRPHRDRGTLASWPPAARRRVSVVVFLNTCRELPGPGEFSGGGLRLLDDRPREIVPQQGLLVAFPASTLHEVAPVGIGTRDVIVDWFY